ncbi:hypothetical protein ACWEKT_34550 [Nocardia takedensis]
MSLPSLLEYQQAVLHPELAFARDPELQRGSAVITPVGVAAVASGGFAATFRIDNAATGQSYAVRCFHKLGTDNSLAQRYEQIARFVATHRQLDCIVDVHYDPQGIVVGGRSFPTVRMPWVKGDPLGDWVDDHYDEPDEIQQVRRNLADALAGLHALRAAHGDLQHGNIMVGADRSVTLIDYDGLYLPELASLGAAERGHPNYQHPDRSDSTYDQDIDAFSAYVIDLSLDAIAQDPDLWDRFGGGGQNLLFSASDFADPATSDVFKAVSTGALAPRVERLRNACSTGYENIGPALRGETVPPRVGTVHARAGLDVVLASKSETLRRRQGDQLTVVGTIRRAHVHHGNYGKPVAFLNFGDYRQGDFTIVAFGPVVTELQRRHGRTLDSLRGARVALTGLITLYETEYTTKLTPQMVLARANQLRILDAATYQSLTTSASKATGTSTVPPENAVRPRTTSAAARPAAPRQKPPSPTTAGGSTSDLLGTMMARYPAPTSPPPGRTRTPAQEPVFATPPSTAQATWTTSTPRAPSQPMWTPTNNPVPPPPRYGTSASYSSQPYSAVRRHPRRRLWARVRPIIMFLLTLVALLWGLAIFVSMAEDDSTVQQTPTPTSAPVRFRSESGNLSCSVTFEPQAAIRCDVGTVRYRPPPAPPDCVQPTFGHAIVLVASEDARFVCAPDSLIDRTLPILGYGRSRTDGPFTCDSDRDRGFTCRDNSTGRGFRIERDSFELY